MTPDSELAVRITVRRPPSGVTFAVQRGHSELLEPSIHAPDALVFDFSVRVAASQSGATPRLLGPFTQGPAAARFVYVNTGRRAGQLTSNEALQPTGARKKEAVVAAALAPNVSSPHLPSRYVARC